MTRTIKHMRARFRGTCFACKGFIPLRYSIVIDKKDGSSTIYHDDCFDHSGCFHGRVY